MAEQTCNRRGAPDALYRCELYSQISDLEPLLNTAENGVQALFQILDTASPTISRKAVDFVADQLNEILGQIKDRWGCLIEEAAGHTGEEAREARFQAEVARREAEAEG